MEEHKRDNAITDPEDWTYAGVEQKIAVLPRFPGDLQNLKLYLKKLNHPEKDLRVIHVAGTNGKGSVCAFLESILRQAGYRTAMFTSPHLVTMRERFRIGEKMVSEQDVVRAFLKVYRIWQEGRDRGLKEPVFFEYLFLMGVVIFSEEKPDYCLMETGMGGRLDPTVLLYPLLSVITSVSLDHTGILGNSIEEIAWEKAGIIKPGVPLVLMKENQAAFDVVNREAARKKSPVYVLDSQDLKILKKTKNYIDFSIDNSYYYFSALRVWGRAGYQVLNGSLAAVAAGVLLPGLPRETVYEGIVKARWPGRMQEIYPGIYVDGGHNPGAADRIVKDLEDSGDRWNLLFSVCDDKDYQSMIRRLCDFPFGRIYVTGMRDERTAAWKRLLRLFEENTDCPVSGWPDVRSGLDKAKNELKSGENLLCMGSLKLVGEILREEVGSAYFGQIERED